MNYWGHTLHWHAIEFILYICTSTYNELVTGRWLSQATFWESRISPTWLGCGVFVRKLQSHNQDGTEVFGFTFTLCNTIPNFWKKLRRTFRKIQIEINTSALENNRPEMFRWTYHLKVQSFEIYDSHMGTQHIFCIFTICYNSMPSYTTGRNEVNIVRSW